MYLDPGSGSMILQVLLAVLFGAGVLAKIFWRKIKTLFGKNRPEVEHKGDDVESYGESDL